MNVEIELTPSCIEKLTEIIAEETQSPDKKMYLRVFVQGGGCSGFQYGFTLEECPTEEDFVKDYTPTVSLVVDYMSSQYLNGSKVDYVVEEMESKFVINNPNATTTCGCGASFSV